MGIFKKLFNSVSYVQPADQASRMKYVIYMDVSQVNKNGKKLPPKTAGFTNSPFDTYEEALKQAGLYAKEKYPNDKISMTVGAKGKNDGFILVESKNKPTQNDMSMYIIKFWIKHTDYYHVVKVEIEEEEIDEEGEEIDEEGEEIDEEGEEIDEEGE
jgi:signal recognition particle subunit SEC65